MIRHSKLLGLAVAGALGMATAVAYAQTTTTTTTTAGTTGVAMPYQRDFWGYAGVGVGRSDFKINCPPTVAICDDRDVGAKIWAGGRMTPATGFEAGVVHMGEATIGVNQVRSRGIFAHFLAGVPFGQSSFNAKVGTIYSHTRVSGVGGGRDNGFGLSYGLAAIIGLSPTMDLRFDWDRHRMRYVTGRTSDHLYSVGLQWKFQ